MLAHFDPGSAAIVAMLIGCFILVLAFEATNGFHDTSNAVATVIYTNALKPVPAVMWSGLLNFVGVIVGGIAVAYALVEILPPDVLTPPDGSPAVPMLVALFAAALFWNVLTWAFGIPNSSSHCIIGALIGVAGADALMQARGLGQGVDWHQIIKVLEALAISPILGPGRRRRAVCAAAAGGPHRPSVRAAGGGQAAGVVAARPADPDLHLGQLLARHQ